MSESAAHQVIEDVLRSSYGQLIAYLSVRTGDVAGAEDALSDALVAALKKWPEDGIPQKPAAWLLHVARNRLIDAARHAQISQRSEEALLQIAEEAQQVATTHEHFPDERLKLLFVCAHPAIDPAARTPLMLQAVLGIGAAEIASAFLTSPTAMSQRLVRAKLKIRDAAIPFRVPDPPEWSERLSFVLDAIYAAYTTGWESMPDTASTHHALGTDAIALGRVVAQLMPGEPEAAGLLALMLHCEARREARYADQGEYIPLDRQDTAKWSHMMIDEAERYLRVAASFKRPGRFQLEAAIQSVHASRAETGRTEWTEIAFLYEALVQVSPGVGSMVGRAVAVAQAGNPAAGLAILDAIPPESVKSYQPYWAARAHLLFLLLRKREARLAWERAAGLTDDPALRRYLVHRLANNGDVAGGQLAVFQGASEAPISESYGSSEQRGKTANWPRPGGLR